MYLLRNLLGSLTSGIVRLAVVLGVLLAAYLLLLKPALNRTDHALDSVNHAVEHAIGNGPKRVGRCVERSNGNVERLQRCARRF